MSVYSLLFILIKCKRKVITCSRSWLGNRISRWRNPNLSPISCKTFYFERLIRGLIYVFEFRFQETNFWTWTGIRTSDLQITSLALLPIELLKFPFQFMFKRSSWNDKCQTLSTFLHVIIWNTAGPLVCDTICHLWLLAN